jgi:hypothetical protein
MADHDPSNTAAKPEHAPEHPKDRPLEPDDPMEMMATAVTGDPLIMLDSIVEEYARMGWGRDQITELFDSPFFQATHGLKKLLGKDEIERRIEATLKRCGVLRVRSSHQDPGGKR